MTDAKKNHATGWLYLAGFAVWSVLNLFHYMQSQDTVLKYGEREVEDMLRVHGAIHHFSEHVQKKVIYKLQRDGVLEDDWFEPKVLSGTYIAREVQKRIDADREKKGLPKIRFKLASSNARNPINDATPEEAELLRQMNDEGLGKVNEIREIDGEQFFYAAIPMLKNKESCMRCHDTPDRAPKGLVEIYGAERAFNESIGDIRAFISIQVPVAGKIADMRKQSQIFALVSGGLIFFIVFGVTTFLRKIQRKNRELSAAIQAKSDFLATMSHEIRTPMHGIIGLSRLALARHPKGELQEDVSQIQQSANRLLAIINDILDHSKIEAGKVELEAVNFKVGSLIEQLKSTTEVMASEKSVALIYQVDPSMPDFLLGDSTRLQQVLINLIGNAIKFTEKGSITVEMVLTKQSENDVWVRFSVRDTGIGLTEEQISRLFTTFTQADTSTTRKFGGTGLGLSISRQLVKLMRGEIGVESTFGEGSNFFFEIPLTTTASGAVSRQEIDAVTPSLKGMKVLLADDHLINQKIARHLLQDVGIEVTTVDNGLKASHAVQEDTFDLVLMDIHMPEMDGYDAARQIRYMYSAEELPIVAMTAGVMVEDRNKAIEAGMNDHIAKPIDVSILYQLLEQYWDKSMLSKQNKGRAEQAVQQWPETLPGLEIADGLRRTAGNAAVYREVVSSFSVAASEIIAQIKQGMESGSCDEVQVQLHSLKGITANISANDLSNLIAGYEVLLSRGDKLSQDDLDQLDASVVQLQESIKVLLEI